MSILDIIIGVVIISLCLSVAITGIMYRYNKKHDEHEAEISKLKAKIYDLEERLAYVDASHKWHMTKYH
jgi:hypothetical protein